MLPEKDGKNPIDFIGISSQSQRRWEEPLSRASMLSLNRFSSVCQIHSVCFFSFSYANPFVSASAEWCKNLKWDVCESCALLEVEAKQRRVRRGFLSHLAECKAAPANCSH